MEIAKVVLRRVRRSAHVGRSAMTTKSLNKIDNHMEVAFGPGPSGSSFGAAMSDWTLQQRDPMQPAPE